MHHADAPQSAAIAIDAAPSHADDRGPVIQDAAMMMWVVVGAIAAWSAIVIFFVL